MIDGPRASQVAHGHPRTATLLALQGSPRLVRAPGGSVVEARALLAVTRFACAKPRTLPTSSESKRPNAGSAEFVRLAVLPKQLGRVAIAGYSGRRADM